MSDKLIETLLKVSKIIDFLIDKLILFMLIVSFILGGYSLYDTWMIYDGANHDEILAIKPNSNPNSDLTPEDVKNSFKELLEINEDVVGWITITNTKIDYPILHGDSNFDYINTDVYGEYALSGSIFLDARGNSSLLDNYSIIYGHHMDNGAMFGGLDSFLKQDYLESHNKAVYTTLDKVYRMKIFACIRCDAYDMDYYTPISEDSNQYVIDRIKEDAVTIIESDIPQNGEKIVAFSTCASESTNGRIVLFGSFTD